VKTLYLLRHAKSNRDESPLPDFDRPLNKRGKKDALIMADAIAEHCSGLQHVYSSPAKRCRSTVKRIRTALDTPPGELTLDDALYTFESADLFSWLKERDNNLDRILVTGHNPALHDLIALLSGRALRQFPSASFAEIFLRIEYWDQLRPGCGELQHCLSPRDFYTP
jgi:phosphohistidine phosphatase